MVERRWIGGGNNNASNASDWSPGGVPLPGDTLRMVGAGLTMNVAGNDLAGDRVLIGSSPYAGASVTVNLAGQAVMNVANAIATTGTFNMTEGSTLSLKICSGSQAGKSSAVVNLYGNENFTLDDTSTPVTVNLLQSGVWTGTLTMRQGMNALPGKVTVNGGEAGSSFNNIGQSVLQNDEQAVIGTDVTGSGSFNLSSYVTYARPSIEFGGAVGGQQLVSNGGLVVIDRPDQFLAAATLMDARGSVPAEIDLMGLASADSYTFQNDMLSIFSGASIIDTLRLHDSTTRGFVVQKDSDSVNVLAITDPNNPPVGLPVHV